MVSSSCSRQRGKKFADLELLREGGQLLFLLASSFFLASLEIQLLLIPLSLAAPLSRPPHSGTGQTLARSNITSFCFEKSGYGFLWAGSGWQGPLKPNMIFQTANLLKSFGKVLLKSPDMGESDVSEICERPKSMLLEVGFTNCPSGCLLNSYGIFLSLCQSTWLRKKAHLLRFFLLWPNPKIQPDFLSTGTLELHNRLFPQKSTGCFHHCLCDPGKLSHTEILWEERGR